MSEPRKQMTQAIKEVVLPVLRRAGFVGSFPHLRRHRAGGVDLMTFQFDTHGGGFILEIGQCDPQGFTTAWGKEIPIGEMNVSYLRADLRARIKPREGAGTDSWFRYDRTGDSCSRTAAEVLPFLARLDALYDGLARRDPNP